MRFYHASDFDIDVPCLKTHRLNSDASVTGNRVLGLFCNTMRNGLDVFGDKLYSFTIKKDAVIEPVPDDFRQPGRCAAYYAGIRDYAMHRGTDVFIVDHGEKVTSGVILNFDVIEDWKLEGVSS